MERHHGFGCMVKKEIHGTALVKEKDFAKFNKILKDTIKDSEFVNKLSVDIWKGLDRMNKNCCPYCGTKMINIKDSITKKKSEYLWQCPNKCLGKNIVLSKG